MSRKLGSLPGLWSLWFISSLAPRRLGKGVCICCYVTAGKFREIFMEHVVRATLLFVEKFEVSQKCCVSSKDAYVVNFSSFLSFLLV